jgi:hypothetical protein
MTQLIFLVANGDLRLSANQKCWPVQADVEAAITAAVQARGREVRRAHDYDPVKQHGFIDSQKRGIEVFRTIPEDAPLLVVEAVWQYSQHLMAGLLHHKGPILTIANWSGQWPGLVGLLNLNASLRKAGKDFDTLWPDSARPFACAAHGQNIVTAGRAHIGQDACRQAAARQGDPGCVR